MSDEADLADAQEQAYLAAALARRQATIPAVGQCYSCAERVAEGRRFCDSDCATDWERIEAARRRGGRE
jgi:hypothetical protein